MLVDFIKINKLYAGIALLASFFILGYLFLGDLSDNYALLLLSFLFVFILIVAAVKTKWVLFLAFFWAPIFIGLDHYQINFGSFFGGLTINPFSLLCLFLIMMSAIELIGSNAKIFKTPLIFIICISIALNTISLYNSSYLGAAGVFYLYFLTPFAVYFLTFNLLKDKKDYFHLSLVIAFSAVVPILVALAQVVWGQYLFEGDSSLARLQGSFPHSNTFGSFLFVVGTILVGLYLSWQNKKRKYLLAFLGIVLLFLVLTFSRTALLGFGISVLVFALLKSDFRKQALAGGIISGTILLLFSKTRERLLGIFHREMFDSVYGRLEIWDMAMFRFKQNPVKGYGMGSFEEVIKETQNKETGNVYPHNDSIRFLLEGGALGFLGYWLYLLGAFYYALRSYLKYSKDAGRLEQFNLLGKSYQIDFKLLGAVPLILFAAMIPISFVEAPSMDFVYQIMAWGLLGSWLGVSETKNGK